MILDYIDMVPKSILLCSLHCKLRRTATQKLILEPYLMDTMSMSGPTSATFEDSDEDLEHGPVTRSRGKLLEKLGSLISLSNRSVTFADSKERKSRTLTINH